jgi:hypothetical protein
MNGIDILGHRLFIGLEIHLIALIEFYEIITECSGES